MSFDIKNFKNLDLFLYWQIAIITVISITAYEVPYSFIFQTPLTFWNLALDLMISFLFIVDIALYLHLKNNSNHSLNFNFKYGWGSILIDILCIFPYDLLSYLFSSELTSALQFIRILRVLKIFRLIPLFQMYPDFFERFKIISTLLCLSILFHWISCFWLFFTLSEELSNYQNYINALYWTITTITTVGFGDITPQTYGSKIYTMFIMLLGVAFYGGILGFISRAIVVSSKHEQESKERINDLFLLMKRYQIPDSLQKEAYSYTSHVLKNRLGTSEEVILKDLPKKLQNEFKIYMVMKVVKEIPLFKEISDEGIKEICQKLELKLFSPGSFIIRKGSVAKYLFIISHGELVVLDDRHHKIADLSQGECFGEIALLQDTIRTASVMAASYCEIYCLEKEAFNDLALLYPQLKINLMDVMKSRSK